MPVSCEIRATCARTVSHRPPQGEEGPPPPRHARRVAHCRRQLDPRRDRPHQDARTDRVAQDLQLSKALHLQRPVDARHPSRGVSQSQK